MTPDKQSQKTEPNISVSQIADLAGVRPSAVSNWRRRHKDFPSPSRKTEGGRDLFYLAEVQEWLSEHDRKQEPLGEQLRLWTAAELLRSEVPLELHAEIVCSGLSLTYFWRSQEQDSLRETPTKAPALDDVRGLVAAIEGHHPNLINVFTPIVEIESATASKLLDLTFATRQDKISQIFELALTMLTMRHGTGHRGSEATSGPQLTQLLMTLAGDQARTVFDPAAGWAGILLEFAKKQRKQPTLVGQELNLHAWRIARQRLLVHDIDAELICGNSLLADAFPRLHADLVVCDPPYGVKLRLPAESMTDPRWKFGAPPATNTDFAWIQHVIYHLAPGGSGYIVSPAGTLFRGGKEAEIRSELVRQGAVEAVVSLPPGIAASTSIPLALWVVRQPKAGTGSVLFIDANASTGEDRVSLNAQLSDEIASVLESWRQQGTIPQESHRIARAIPTLELLRRDTNLTPVRWVYEEPDAATLEQVRQRLAEASKQFERAGRRLGKAKAPNQQHFTATGEPRWVRVEDLVSDDLAQVIRGVHVKSEHRLGKGVRILRARDIREGIKTASKPCYAAATGIKPKPTLTMPGDIIMSPGSGEQIAVVDEEGGHVLAQPLQALRIKGEWARPEVLAAFLQSPRNRRFVKMSSLGSASRARVNIRELEIPVIPLEAADRLWDMLQEIEQAESYAKEVEQSSQAIREALLDLASSDLSGSKEHINGED